MNVLRFSGNPSSEAVLPCCCWAFRGCRGVHSSDSVQPWQALKPRNFNDAPDQHRQILRPQQSSTRREEKESMAGQNGVQFQPLSSSYVYTKYGNTKYGCSNFPVSTFVSWFWQVISSASYYLSRMTDTQHFRHFSLFISFGPSPFWAIGRSIGTVGLFRYWYWFS